jgi:hypothetical protein
MTATAIKRKAKVLRPSRVGLLLHYDPWDPANENEVKAMKQAVSRRHRGFRLLCYIIVSRPHLGVYYHYAEFARA